jgi:rhamnosyltransferase subunit B
MAIALRDAGHAVTLLAPDLHEPSVRRAGLAFHPLVVDPAVLDDPHLWDVRKGFGVVWRATRPAMAQLPAFVAALPEGERCVLLVHPLAIPEADLCRFARPGTKIVAAYLAPSNLPTVHDPLMMGPLSIPRWVPLALRRWMWRQVGARLIDPVALPDVNAARRACGLPGVPGLLAFLIAVPDLSVMLCPAWFARTQPDWPQPLLRVGFPLHEPEPDFVVEPELARFLASGAAPIVFTPGTGNRQAGHYFRCALEALRQLDQRGSGRRRAIFLTPHAEQIPPDLPDHVLWQAYLPLRALLPQVAALVHHGGIGTTAEALRAGTRQLVVPLAHDQFDNAARVEALGAGLVLPASRLNSARLTRSLRRLLAAPSMAEQCRAAAAKFDGEPDMDELCRVLARLAARAD